MKIIYKVKDVLGITRGAMGGVQDPGPQQMARSPSSDLHTVPPGQWPKEGPKPSKCAILCYYMSVALTVIGMIMVIRAAMFLEVCCAFVH